MVELRKRPARAASSAATAPPPAKRGATATAKATAAAAGKKAKGKVAAKEEKEKEEEEEEEKKDEEAEEEKNATTAPPAAAEDSQDDGKQDEKEAEADAEATGDAEDTVTKLGPDSVGKRIELSGAGAFGGSVTTHEGKSVAVKDLLEQSAKGIAIFTYPRASTPGCTTQACLFRDSYAPITDAGVSVYGLSTDSEKANTTFATKQKLPYPLLCDPKATLTGAIGMAKGGKSTTRGVVVIDKQGTVRVWLQAGPQKTLDAVLAYIDTAGSGDNDK